MVKTKMAAVVPIYGRPQRTKRLIDQLHNQGMAFTEIWLIGDGCPDFEQYVVSQDYIDQKKSQREYKQSEWYAINLPVNHGGYGYFIRNLAKTLVRSPYLCFIDNDDCVKMNHMPFYYNNIVNTDYDFVYHNVWNNALGLLRNSQPSQGLIGHAELVIKTEFYRGLPDQTGEYGHDWSLIREMMAATTNYAKAQSDEWTYKVMSTPMKREENID